MFGLLSGLKFPTAQMSVGEAAETAPRLLSWLPTFGLGTCVQSPAGEAGAPWFARGGAALAGAAAGPGALAAVPPNSGAITGPLRGSQASWRQPTPKACSIVA